MLRTASKALLAAAVVKSGSEIATPTINEQKSHSVCKPSDLPIYTPHAEAKPKKSHTSEQQDSAVHRNIESGVRVVRSEVQSAYDAVAQKAGILNDYIDTAKAHTQSTIDYLNEPQNTLPRSGAIAIGGLAGFIFAARGGFIKKVVYTSIGAGAVASLCYPHQAEEQAKVALCEGRKAFAVAYNFIKGVKPGDESAVDPVSKFPTSLGDLKHIAWDLYDDAKDVLFSKKK